jgi:T-complex protein 1 subunit alpha
LKKLDKGNELIFRELDILKERIQLILEAGANVILTTGGIDDVANKYLVEAGVLGLRRVSKSDIRKIAKCSGASLVTTLSNVEGSESFDPALLGSAKRVYEKAVGDNDFIFFE